MSAADDQRAAAVERAMKLQAGTVLAREVDRLRAELAETRAAAGVLYGALSDPRRIPVANDVVARALTGWERLVRGDAPAPAEPPVPLSVQLTRESMTAFHEQNIAAPAAGCVHPLSAGSGECVRKDYCGSGGSCQPVELPVTLSSVGAVMTPTFRQHRAAQRYTKDQWEAFREVMDAFGCDTNDAVSLFATMGAPTEPVNAIASDWGDDEEEQRREDAIEDAIEAARGGSR